jgi:hypothetical protein
MKSNGVYSIIEDHYILEVYYDYYWDYGDYHQPPESTLEIEKVELNGKEITDFYFDYLDYTLYDKVMEHAEENKDEEY